MQAVVYVALLVAVYIIGYTLNARTPKPEGCELVDAACNSCHVGVCSFHPSQQNKQSAVLNKEEV
jgi:cytochrome c5